MTQASRAPRSTLIGRAEVLGDIGQLLASGRHVLLTGRAGVGKTRLAAEALEVAVSDGRRVERIMASASTAAFQLGAFAPLALPANVGTDVPSLLGFHLDRWRSQVRANQAPSVLWIDDVHHLDSLSAVLCRHAVTAGVVQLMLTHREPEALPADIVAMLTADELVTVDVRSLSRSATVELAQQSSERPLTDAELDRIRHLSDGFPLFVRDLARCLDSGNPLDEVHRGSGLHEILSNLPTRLRRVAELIAVAEPLPIRFLARYRTELMDLIARGVARRHGEDDIRLEHPLYSSWFIEALGPLVDDVFDELVAATEGLDVNPTIAAEWRIRAGRSLDPDLAARAMHEALSRSDASTAQRLLPHLTGEGSEVMAAEAVVLSGDLDDGLARLDDLRRGASTPELRVQAAGVLARHLGLTKGDFAAARAVLDEADDEALSPSLRAPLLVGRIWLAVFGGPIVPEDLDLAHQLVDRSHPPTQETHDLLTASLTLGSQLSGARADSSVVRLREVEEAIAVSEEGRTLSVCTVGWTHFYAGDAPACLERFERRFRELAEANTDAEGIGLVGGSGGYAAAVCGAVQLGVAMASASVEASTPIDWFGFGHLGALVLRGNQVLANGASKTRDRPPAPPAAPVALDLAAVLAARAESLWIEASGFGTPASTLLGPLTVAAEHQRRSWVLISSELIDLRSDQAIHELMAETARLAGTDPLHAASATLASARLAGDAEGVLGASELFEGFGHVAAASRAFADVLRLVDDESALRPRAVQGLARCLLSWDGGAMFWTSDLTNIPTKRQLIVAHRAASGLPSGEIADELVLSKRTIENHLYRATRSLGVSAREELADVLAPRGFGARIVPTDAH